MIEMKPFGIKLLRKRLKSFILTKILMIPGFLLFSLLITETYFSNYVLYMKILIIFLIFIVHYSIAFYLSSKAIKKYKNMIIGFEEKNYTFLIKTISGSTFEIDKNITAEREFFGTHRIRNINIGEYQRKESEVYLLRSKDHDFYVFRDFFPNSVDEIILK